jgi:predicted transposase YbfD/YdcC
MGCQRTIAAKILEKEGDYLVTLGANQGKKFAAVQEHCAATCFGRSPIHRPLHAEFDDGHGRLVRRWVFVCADAAELEPLRDWPGLKTVLAVESIRTVNGSGKTEVEIRYFLSSSAEQPEILATAIRGRSRTACIGCSTLPSTKITAGYEIATRCKTSRCSVKSRSILSVAMTPQRQV